MGHLGFLGPEGGGVTSAGQGFTCPGCLTWVPYGSDHGCGRVPSYPVAAALGRDYELHAKLDRIMALLESLASAPHEDE